MTAFLGATRTACDSFAADYAKHFSGDRSATKSHSTTYRRQPEPVIDLLTAAGFTVVAQPRRKPDPTEITPRAFLFAASPPCRGTRVAWSLASNRGANDPGRSTTTPTSLDGIEPNIHNNQGGGV